jgi:putative toxin-antitoxin system antitoxin component (TIGR02293 family)
MRPKPHVIEPHADVANELRPLHLILGELLGFKRPVTSEIDLMERLERGLPASSVQALRTRAGLTESEVYQYIAPRRTLQRRETERQPLAADEADRTIRIARAAARAQQVFSGKPAYAIEWLRGAQRSLGGRAPIEALTSEPGARAVDELLIGIEHGMFGA